MSQVGVDGALLLDQVPAAVIAVDLEHRVVLWSVGAERLYGWSPEEALGRSVRDLILAAQVPLADEVSAATHSGGVWEGEVVVRHRDGSDLLVHVRNAPLRDGGGAIVGVIGASLDVAEARRVESARARQLVTASREAADAVERLGRLQRLTAALVPLQEQADVVATICHDVVAAVGADAAAVMLLDEPGSSLVLAGTHGYPSETVAAFARVAFAPGLPVTDAVLRDEVLLFGDADVLEERYPGVAAPDAPFSARACVPVTSDGRALGALVLAFRGPHDFDDDERELLLTIARMCGQALERSRLFTAERRARVRAAFVSAATTLLASSLQVDLTLQHLTELFVPDIADCVIIHLLDDAGEPQLAAVTARDAELGAWVREQAEQDPVDLQADGGMGEVLRLGQARLYPTLPQSLRDRVVGTFGAQRAAALVPQSAIGVPLLVAGRVLGAIALLRGAGEAFTDEELVLAQEVADRAAIAVSHARAFDRERDAALTLQQSLLPQQLPSLPGLAYAWRYLPGTEGVHVGGDWYDVVALEHGRVAVVVGDVMGRGLRAAAVMGQLRATARAHVTASSSPSEVLRELDLAVTRLEQGSITTVLVGVLDPATGRFTYASAGHLPPLHASAQGGTAYLAVDPGPPLGAGATHWPQGTARLSPGDTLLLYTDGLVEDRVRPVTEGMEVLRASVSSPSGPHEAVAAALAGTGRDVGHDDDTAVLALTLAPREESAPHFVCTHVTGPAAAREARTAVRSGLLGWALPAWVVDDVLIVVTELVVNAVLHAGGEVEVAVRRSPDGLRLEVRDGRPDLPPLPSLTSLTRAEGRPDDAALDAVITALDQGGTTGRGMTLVSGIADDWGWAADETGKAVWAVFRLDPASVAPAAPPAARDEDVEVAVVLRGLPVRLVLASASHLDDLQREVTTGPQAPAVLSVLERGLPLLLETTALREPFRAAARDALGRGQRLVDVQAPVTASSVRALRSLHAMYDEVDAMSRAGVLLTPMPDEEVWAFRRWWADEVERQLHQEPPRECPFPALPQRGVASAPLADPA